MIDLGCETYGSNESILVLVHDSFILSTVSGVVVTHTYTHTHTHTHTLPLWKKACTFCCRQMHFALPCTSSQCNVCTHAHTFRATVKCWRYTQTEGQLCRATSLGKTISQKIYIYHKRLTISRQKIFSNTWGQLIHVTHEASALKPDKSV